MSASPAEAEGSLGPLRIAAVQMPHGHDVDGNLEEARRWLDEARRRGVRLALLPEYFFADLSGEPAQAEGQVRRFLADVTKGHEMVVAANAIEPQGDRKHNVGLVYADGAPILEQAKVHPMPREVEHGVEGGTGFPIAPIHGVPVGMLVCSDVLYPEAARILSLRGARILLNPVMSPHMQVDPDRSVREALYLARAYDAGAFVIKAGGYHAGDPAVAGRSLVAAPWGMVAHYRDAFEPQLLVADLDLERLEGFRRHQERFPPRRPDLYRPLVEEDG